MPTGYTAMIDDDPTMDTAKWVTEGISRAFGVCLSLRDSGVLNADQIEEHLKENIELSTKYYRVELAHIEKTLEIIEKEPDTYWTTKYASMVRKYKQYNKKNRSEANKSNSRHGKIREDLILLREETEDEITRGLAEFGLEQLGLVTSQHEPYIHVIPTFEAFQNEKMASLNRDLEYYKKNIHETEKRETDRLIAYQKIRSEVNRILKAKQKEDGPE